MSCILKTNEIRWVWSSASLELLQVHKKSSSKQKRCPVDYSEVTLFESDM